MENDQIFGKTLSDWEKLWERIGILSSIDLSSLNNKVGLFLAKIDDEVMNLGIGTEIENGGLKKRLEDFRRSSVSGRDYFAGEEMFNNKEKINIEVLIIEQDNYKNISNTLKEHFTSKYKPKWVKML